MKLKQLHVKMGLCSLNNDPLDFKKNYKRIYQSIEQCRRLNCSIRVGGELQIPGYSCEDHFLEYDTVFHSWDVIKDLIVSGVTNGIVAEVGCPVLHKAALYNGRVILFNSKVVGIRVKMILADGGNYFQTRYFSYWKHPRKVDQFMLPQFIQEVTGQKIVPIGMFIMNFNDTNIAYQICQEAWISNNPMIDAALDGAEIFINVSGSEVERGKLKRKMQMLQEFTERHGGAYVYVNIKGGVGSNNYYDGCCFFTENGKVKELSEPFHLGEVQVTPVTINLNAIRTLRINNKSFQKESHGVSVIPRIKVDFNIAVNEDKYIYDSQLHKQELSRKRFLYEFEYASYEPSVYLWDLLRKTKGARGFYLTLSGGINDSTVALIVYNMCFLLFQQIKNSAQSQQILEEFRKVIGEPAYKPNNPQEMCNKIFYTTYFSTENSSKQQIQIAQKIAEAFGSKHRSVSFEEVYNTYQHIAKSVLDFEPKFKSQGGSSRSDQALTGVKSRTRMVLTYFLAALELEKSNISGHLIVLGHSNLDEALRGHFTKYGSNSADINPIGSFSKLRLQEIVAYFHQVHRFDVLEEVLNASAINETKSIKEGGFELHNQEKQMGLTYAELCTFGRLRKCQRLGPVSMFDRMYYKELYEDLEVLADKIKKFFTYYADNRHKVTILPPAFHYDPESCEDKRFDMRPWLYATDWSYQFDIIDDRVKELKKPVEENVFGGFGFSVKKTDTKKTQESTETKTEQPRLNLLSVSVLPPRRKKSQVLQEIFNS